jgi:hypothetical protein
VIVRPERRCHRASKPGASAMLVTAGVSTNASAYVQPTVTSAYPRQRRATEQTPVRAELETFTDRRSPKELYNVCRNGERMSNEKFRRPSGWRPER